jgi:hypothetical protein
MLHIVGLLLMTCTTIQLDIGYCPIAYTSTTYSIYTSLVIRYRRAQTSIVVVMPARPHQLSNLVSFNDTACDESGIECLDIAELSTMNDETIAVSDLISAAP